MKKLILSAVLAVLAGAAFAQQAPGTIAQVGFSVCTTNPGTSSSYAIVSANSASGGAPIVQYINAGTDLAYTSRLQFYRVDAYTSANYSNSTVTLPVASTNGIGVSGDIIIIRHVGDDKYEKRTLTASSGSTNLVTTVAPLEAVAPGDFIYHVTTSGAGCIRWGATTNSIGPSNGAIYTGQAGFPLLMDLTGTSGAEINTVSGIYSAR